MHLRFVSKADLTLKIVDFRPALVKISAVRANWPENGAVQQYVVVG